LVAQENEQLKRKIIDLEADYQKMINIENRAAQMGIEIERLNNVLRGKMDETGAYQR
jgi:hypothetical protein